jgi:hypothetical protein
LGLCSHGEVKCGVLTRGGLGEAFDDVFSSTARALERTETRTHVDGVVENRQSTWTDLFTYKNGFRGTSPPGMNLGCPEKGIRGAG